MTGPLKRALVLKHSRRLSGRWVGWSDHADSTEIFTQIWFGALSKPKFFRFFPLNISILAPSRSKIIEIRDKGHWKTLYSLEGISERESLKCHTILDLSFED